MSGSVNKVILVGNLGRDPEIRRTASGDPVVSFSLATSESWKDKNTGERKENVSWHNIVIFNDGLCSIVEQYCKKGSKIYVEGKMQSRKYTDRDGNERYTTEVVLQKFGGTVVLLERSERPAPEPESYGKTTTRQQPQQSQQYDDDRMAMGGKSTSDFIDDDIPF